MDAAGSSAKLATFDLNVDAAQAIKDGKIQFSVDQQPYVQGYLAVQSLYLNRRTATTSVVAWRAHRPSFVDTRTSA